MRVCSARYVVYVDGFHFSLEVFESLFSVFDGGVRIGHSGRFGRSGGCLSDFLGGLCHACGDEGNRVGW